MDKDISTIDPTHPIFLALVEIQKPRSKFQLEKFVMNQHDTPEQKYKQILLEIQSLIYSIKIVRLELQKSNIEINKLLSSGNEIDAIDAQIKTLGIEQTNLTLIGAERELKDLIELWESFEHKYTYEEIEKSQEIYWESRLIRQAQLESIGNGNGIGWSSLDSLRQIGKFNISEEIERNQIKELKNG